MNQEWKAKWLVGLRSGEYQQGKSSLNRDNKEFCCLGVLCDIVHKETGMGAWVERDYPGDETKKVFTINGEKDLFELPYTVVELVGLELSDPFTSYSGDLIGDNNLKLSQLNDRGHSFEFIANMIEKDF